MGSFLKFAAPVAKVVGKSALRLGVAVGVLVGAAEIIDWRRSRRPARATAHPRARRQKAAAA